MHRLKIKRSLSFVVATLSAMASLGLTACNLLDSASASSTESSSSVQADNPLSSSSAPGLNMSSQAFSSSSLTQPNNPNVSSSSASSSSGSKPVSSSSDAIISGEVVSCDMQIDMQIIDENISTHFCAEIPASSLTEELKTTCTDDESLGMTASLGKACPSGAVLVCTETQDGVTATSYYYDAEYEGMTCEEANAE